MKKTISIFSWVICVLILSAALMSCHTGDDNVSDMTIPIVPSQGYLTRKAMYLNYCNDNNGPGSGGLYGQVCRAYTGAGSFNETAIYDRLVRINNREDTSDFAMNAILRILFLDRRNPTLPDALRNEMNNAALNFKYWLDEPGPDDMCWWSENHQSLFHTAELLAGILFPDSVFSNSGMTGREHMEHARPMIHKWLDYRSRFGFSEFHSNVYFDEDMPPLVNLVDFADEESIRIRAAMILDVLAFDMIGNYYKGLFATTHGRTYPGKLVNGLNDSTTEAAWLMVNLVDIGSINELGTGNFSATFLATSDNYWTPPLLEEIAGDSKSNMEHRQRDGIKIEDGPTLYGITYSNFEDVMFWWGMTGYMAPEIIEGSFNMIDYYNLWEGYQWRDLSMLKPFVGTQTMVGVATDVAPMSRGAALEEVNTYTYRTPYYQLSGAQDWKPFNWTGQVLDWQATIDKNCYVFTAMPANFELLFGASFGSEWTGGFVPRGTIYKNVGVFQYHLPALGDLSMYFGSPIDWSTMLPSSVHAYFPKNQFDQIEETGNWTIGRKGDAYVALYSQTTPAWSITNDYELIADNTDNVWIVEMGDVVNNGSFADFVTSIESAVVQIGSTVHYESPSRGVISVGWTGPMLVNGDPVDLGPYPRWNNPYSYQEFGTKVTRIGFGGKMLELDFNSPKRSLYWQ